MSAFPSTPAQMVDKLHTLFGIGESDDVADTVPWYRDRIVQISKLKALLKSRRTSLAELNIAADYAYEHGKPIHAIWQVFGYIPEALKARFQNAARPGLRHEEMQQAIDQAVDAGDMEWAERLMRATDQGQALQDWRDR